MSHSVDNVSKGRPPAGEAVSAVLGFGLDTMPAWQGKGKIATRVLILAAADRIALVAIVNACNIIFHAGAAGAEKNRTRSGVTGTPIMVERRTELNRRYHRKKKMAKLKARLAAAKSNSEREAILKKIHTLSPWWQEPAAQS